ncbi:hypothetical protein KKI23_01730 [Patescibacteria group bacterium]|nr:hypothetical protein [Patescibacteria group bacterium]
MSFAKIITIIIFLLIIILVVLIFVYSQINPWQAVSTENGNASSNLSGKLVFSCLVDSNWDVYSWSELDDQVEVIVSGDQNERQPAVTPKGDSLIYLLQDDSYNRLVNYFPASGLKNNLVYSKNEITSFEISPDGKKLLFSEMADEQNFLYFYDLIDDQLTNIAEGADSYEWFLDSGKFLYVIDGGVYLSNINSVTGKLDQGQIIFDQAENPVAIPGTTDQFLALTQSDQGINLIILDSSSQEINLFSSLEFDLADPANFRMKYAPDQSSILLVRANGQVTKRAEVWTIGRAGQEITGILSDIAQPVWSGNSQKIYYLKYDQELKSNIWSYDISEQNETKLTDFTNCSDLH